MTFNIHTAKTNLSALIQKALDGEEVIIAKNNEPFVTIKPIKKKKKRSSPGLFKKDIWVAPNIWDHNQELED